MDISRKLSTKNSKCSETNKFYYHKRLTSIAYGKQPSTEIRHEHHNIDYLNQILELVEQSWLTFQKQCIVLSFAIPLHLAIHWDECVRCKHTCHKFHYFYIAQKCSWFEIFNWNIYFIRWKSPSNIFRQNITFPMVLSSYPLN